MEPRNILFALLAFLAISIGLLLMPVKPPWEGQTTGAPTTISACATLSSANTEYVLNQSLTNLTGTCFSITAGNITLDCAGFTLTGNSSANTYGISTNQQTTKIKNCIINEFGVSIYLDGADFAIISNVTLFTNKSQSGAYGNCVYLTNTAQNNRFENMTANTTTGRAFYLNSYSSKNNFTNVTGYASCGSCEAITSSTSSQVTIRNSYFQSYYIPLNIYSYDDQLSPATSRFVVENTVLIATQPNACFRLNQASSNNFTNITCTGSTINSWANPANDNVFRNITATGLTGQTDMSMTSRNTWIGLSLSTSGHGFYQPAAGVYIDCQGGSITYTNNVTTDLGVRIAGTNYIIKNCKFLNFPTAVSISSALGVNGTYINNTFYNSTVGVLISHASATNNTFFHNNFSSISGAYINNSGAGSSFVAPAGNLRGGNIYENVINGSINITGSKLSAVFPSLYVGTNGSAYPYNSTNSGGKFVGTGSDSSPFTPNSGAAARSFTVNGSFNTTTTYTLATTAAYCTVYCADGGSYTHNWTLYRNGVLNQTGTAAVAPENIPLNVKNISADVAGTNWTLECRANDTSTSVSSNTSRVVVQGCQPTTLANTVYTLAQNLSNPGGQACFTVTTQNVTIDCAGFKITGDNTTNGVGVYSTVFNTTVKNCKFSSLYCPIKFNGASNGTVDNITVLDVVWVGVYFYGGTVNTTLKNSNIKSSTNYAIFFNDASTKYNRIENVDANSSNSEAMAMMSGFTTIDRSNATSVTTFAFEMGSANNVLTNSKITGKDNTFGAFIIYNTAQNNWIENNTINGMTGTYAASCRQNVNKNNTFINNTFYNAVNSFWHSSTACGGNYFALNNFSSSTGLYVNDTNGSNFYNMTVNGINQGNIYQNVINTTVNITGHINSSKASLWVGETGAGYPYNVSTSLGKFRCGNATVNYSGCGDFAPLTAQYVNPNTAPTITAISIVPSGATTNDDVSCNLTATDPEQSLLNVSGSFFKNGTLIVNFTFTSLANNTATIVANLSKGNYSAGSNISCNASVFDGTAYSTSNMSANLTILGIKSASLAITPPSTKVIFRLGFPPASCAAPDNQTNASGIYNVTNNGTATENILFSINQTILGFELTISNASVCADGLNMTASPQQLYSSLAPGASQLFWAWAHVNESIAAVPHFKVVVGVS